MTEALCNKLKEALLSEQKGYNEYCHLSDMATNENEPTISSILKDMSHEENSHIRMLRHLISEEEKKW